MSNQLSTKTLFDREDVKQKFQELLGKRASVFMTSVLQIVSQNSQLAEADPMSVYQAAAVAATLDLPLNQNLGFAYIVGYKAKQKDGSFKTLAQFQMGYKGFIQLAQRSGQFKSLYAAPIFEGQIKEANPLDGYQFDFTAKKGDTVIGYAARFKLINGYEATMYMSIEQLNQHGVRFSQTFKKGFGLWKDNFDAMAQKTVIKLLLSKFAPLSVEMQKAVISDQGMIKDADTLDVDYVDNDATDINKEAERARLLIEDAKTIEDLIAVKESLPVDLADLYETKFVELQEKEA